ncbi:MAG: DNA alkylation repair protein [Melioribacteraceae bacterium]|nr:DNA alkylation repair protein [Melioribacteraceae bacterium]
MDLVNKLKVILEEHSNLENKAPMETYMKNKFKFLGIKSPERKNLLRQFISENKGEICYECIDFVQKLYDFPEREFHYCAMEITDKFLRNKYEIKDIDLIKRMICDHSHWDSVDFIAKHILGNYLLCYPDKTKEIISEFSSSNNIWLNRSAILFQLGYKDKTNCNLLFSLCQTHANSKEFFIKKAIGWSLREYAKVNPQSVSKFVKSNKLSTLSQKEALRNIT